MNIGSSSGAGSMGASSSNGNGVFAVGQNLLVIDCNFGKKVADGFKHTVFRKLLINGNKTFEHVDSIKFTDIIGSDYVEKMRKDPITFIKEIENECN